MELNYNKKTLNSILKNAIYYFLWGVAFNVLLFMLIWILSKWKFIQVYNNPFLNPFKGIWFWVIIGVIIGWLKRKRHYKMTFKRWGRTFLYIFFFGAFIMSLQLYYVHRKNGGWNGLTGTECVHKYQSYFLIKDKRHFANLDNCLVSKKVQADNTYKASTYGYRHMEDYKGRLIDYDVINPKIIWALIIFIIISLIEILRRHGPILVYKSFGRFINYWQSGFSTYNKKQLELIFFGASTNLLLLYLLPKVNGMPNGKIPIFLSIALLMVMFRNVIKTKGNDTLSNTKNQQWFFFITGVLLSSFLLIISANKIFYPALILSIIGYLYTSKLIKLPFVKPLILLIVFLDVEFLFALDDGTWTEGGLDTLLNDSDGDRSVNMAEELGGTAAVVVDSAQDDDTDDEDEFRDPFDSSQVDVDNVTKEQIIQNAEELKQRFETLKEAFDAPNVHANIDNAVDTLNSVISIVQNETELSADTINMINDLMKDPNMLYEDLINH